MSKRLLLHGWTLQRDGDPTQTQTPVELPHDAMLSEPRMPDAPSGSHGGYFVGGRYTYRRTLSVTETEAAGIVSIVFEGVYGHATVSFNGAIIASWDSGYREVEVPLDDISAGFHELVVIVDNREQPTGRWYTGSGIYRPVWLRILPAAAIDRRRVTVSTELVGSDAHISVTASTTGSAQPGDRMTLRLTTAGRIDAEAEIGTLGADGAAHLSAILPNPRLWSDVSPHRYSLRLTLVRGEVIIDTYTFPLGVRTIEVDPARGLRINGQPTLLRGACVHHDNGILGAATHRAAEYRRARLLKEAGYNAVRSAHNPLSRAFLDACDELGLYVIDELTDIWFTSKTAHDSADRFDESWRDDATAMVLKDRLRACVIMYSIGNENAETATPRGVAATGDLCRFIRTLDSERPITTGMNFMLNAVAARSKPVTLDSGESAGTSPTRRAPSHITSTLINVLANRLGSLFQLLAKLPAADRATRDALAEVDVAGYNYAWTRYRTDGRKHPSRVILGTESFPGDLPRIWPLVEKLSHVIGDFAWTGWDYLGETGIGTWEYDAGPRSSLLAKPFPHLIAGPGAIDITGIPGAPVALQRAVWGLSSTPTIMVRPVCHSGKQVHKTAWRASDAIGSWSWRGHEGRPAEVEVYSDADEVELILNGRKVGRRRAGQSANYVTRFTVPYENGELAAIAYANGHETGRSSLNTSGQPALNLSAESAIINADGEDLAFIWAELADENRTIDSACSDTVTVSVTGPATLVGFGSSNPAPQQAFTGNTHSTHYGRALIVIRSHRIPGTVAVHAASAKHGIASVDLTVVTPEVVSE